MTLKSDSSKHSALNLISNYSSDESSDAEEDLIKSVQGKKRLPLPSQLLNIHSAKEPDHIDDYSLHDGRTRSFAHQRGNWATFVYIPYEPVEEFIGFCEAIIANCDTIVKLKKVIDPHISLSRTVVLLHHWIDGFVNTLKEKLRHTFSFHICMGKLSVYTNEEKTRTFLGLDVTTGFEELVRAVKTVDECVTEFKLPTFYQDPSFHLSIAWCLEDKKEIMVQILPKLQVYFDQFVQSYPELFTVYVKNIYCKSGNKLFDFKLKL